MKKYILALLVWLLALNVYAEDQRTFLIPGCQVKMNGHIYQFDILQARMNAQYELSIFIHADKQGAGESISGFCQTPNLQLRLSEKPERIIYYIWDKHFRFHAAENAEYKNIKSMKDLNHHLSQGVLVWKNPKQKGFKLHAKIEPKRIHAHLESLAPFQGQKVKKIVINSMIDSTSISIHASGITSHESYRTYQFEYVDGLLKSKLFIYMDNEEGSLPSLPVIENIEVENIFRWQVYAVTYALDTLVKEAACILEQSGEQEGDIKIDDANVITLIKPFFSIHPQDFVKH